MHKRMSNTNGYDEQVRELVVDGALIGTEETRSGALSLEARLGRGPRTCAAASSEERMARILPAPKLLVRLRAQQQLLIPCDNTAGNVIRRYSYMYVA